MYRTISIGSSIMVQGLQERTAPDGRVVIRVGDQMVQGWPVNMPVPVQEPEAAPALRPH